MTDSERLMFGERLRIRRDALGLSQEKVAEQINTSTRYYQMLERGERGVSLEKLVLLSKALSISVDYLLLGDLGVSLENPVAEMVSGLSPSQKADAGKILMLYAKACKDSGESQSNKIY